MFFFLLCLIVPKLASKKVHNRRNRRRAAVAIDELKKGLILARLELNRHNTNFNLRSIRSTPSIYICVRR